MAPIRKKAAARLTRTASTVSTSKPHLAARPRASPSHPTSFPSPSTSTISATKLDKRRIKHSLLLSRITKSSASAHSARRTRVRARRRVAEQLGTSLASLVDALPRTDAVDSVNTKDGVGKLTSTSANASTVRAALVAGRSLKSRAGLQKRRDGVARAERERFGRNIAALAGGRGQAVDEGEGVGSSSSILSGGAAAGTGDEEKSRSDRWAALRRHIEASMAVQSAGAG